ncbi:MAG: hypothetical protein QOH84_4865 [Kribbellaceae bacterium]|nr:hypothetical protein [Kribbellaceae bacterium]
MSFSARPPGLTLRRFERPLAERRLLDDAVLEWVGAGTPVSHPFAVPGLNGYGIMELWLAETRVTGVTSGTALGGPERVCKGSTKVQPPICIFTVNLSNVLLVGASAGRESGRSLRTPRKYLVTEARPWRVFSR